MILSRLVFPLLACVLVALTPAAAQSNPDSLKEMDQKFEQRLAQFDPKAVAAARSYFRNADVGAQMKGMVTSMVPGMVQHLRDRNSGLTEADTKIFFETFLENSIVAYAPLIERWSMLNMLTVFTPEEMIYMDQVFGTELGKQVLAKQPKLMGNFPELMSIIQRHIVPAGLAAAQAKLRSLGKDIKI